MPSFVYRFEITDEHLESSHVSKYVRTKSLISYKKSHLVDPVLYREIGYEFRGIQHPHDKKYIVEVPSGILHMKINVRKMK